ncbi:hypothetical protein C5E45_11150 [Nocardia nova]|uniref:Uncharacterized protein n=1 Tax=Nocardia nova TaxID=37330 RepID=A0A2S6ASU8_9NOCA|nr:hypothetical protein [Nocardia nova]PPJ30122.1 hypothetical protein C5E41_09385 [Nocardia nova]PPJ38290.1 hypothetical protein C5E45_11150 [Nocardia nova]
MAKEIDRVRARSALETVKESPFIALVVAVPVIAVLGVVWALTNWFVALLVLVLLGAVVVVRGKFLR